MYILKTKTFDIIDGPDKIIIDTALKSKHHNRVLFLIKDKGPRIARISSVYPEGELLKISGYAHPITNHSTKAAHPFTAIYDATKKTGYLYLSTVRRIAKTDPT